MKKLSLFFILVICVLSVYGQNTKKTVESKFQAEIKFEETQHDFGTITEGDTAVWEFSFKNTGDTLLIIDRVATPCSCTSADWPKNPIKPGESGKIKVLYNSKGRPGRFNKTIVIISNSKTNIDKVVISGTVGKEAQPATPQK